MKRKVSCFIAMLLVVSFVLAGFLCVSALKYKENVVADDFSDASKSFFVCPGDIDNNGKLDSEDLSSLVSTLLSASGTAYSDVVSQFEGAKYSDVNGDESVNIIDLVKLKKNISAENFFRSDGTLAFDGKCVYCKSLVNDMGTGATYRITYRYKASTPLTVKINAIGEEKSYSNAISSDWQTAEYTVKTKLSKGSAKDFDLRIDGKGVLDSFNITRLNMDNETVAQ